MGKLPEFVAELKRTLESLPSASRLGEADEKAIYAVAYQEYGQARYREALGTFQILLVYRPTNTNYLLGAAVCLRRLGHFELAAGAYGALSLLQPDVPGHAVSMAECRMLAGQPEDAMQVLKLIAQASGTEAAHAAARRAGGLLELMERSHEHANPVE